MATPIHFISGKYHIKLKAGKSRETCLTNHTWPISHHITPLVINGLGGGHTDTDTRTHIPTREPKQFQETRCVWAKAMRAWFKKALQCGIEPGTSCITHNMCKKSCSCQVGGLSSIPQTDYFLTPM